MARRHQKIAIALEIEPHFAEEAKKRMAIRKGNQPGASKENVPYLPKQPQSRDEAAALVGVNSHFGRWPPMGVIILVYFCPPGG